MKIGTVRRALMVRGTWKWNAWVRDATACLETRGFFDDDSSDRNALHLIRIRLGDFQEPWNEREAEIDEIARVALIKA